MVGWRGEVITLGRSSGTKAEGFEGHKKNFIFSSECDMEGTGLHMRKVRGKKLKILGLTLGRKSFEDIENYFGVRICIFY